MSSKNFSSRKRSRRYFYFTAVGFFVVLFVVAVFAGDKGAAATSNEGIQNNSAEAGSLLIGLAQGGPDIVTYVGVPTDFKGVAISPDADVARYEWDFDGNGTADWSSAVTGSAVNTFSKPGEYQAVFKAYDTKGVQFPPSIIRVLVKKGNGEAAYIFQDKLLVAGKQALKDKLSLSPEEANFLNLGAEAVSPQSGGSLQAYGTLGTSTPPDGIKKIYVILYSGGGESRFWDDVNYAYSMFRNTYFVPASNIYVLNYDGLDPNGQPNSLINYSATAGNMQAVLNTLAGLIDGDDTLFVWVTDHGRGYIGPVQRAPSEQKYFGYLDGKASVYAGGEPDYLESNFKLRALYSGGDYGVSQGMDVWATYHYYLDSNRTMYYRVKYVSHFSNLNFTMLGVQSDNDVYIERFIDYLQGDTNKDGIIDTSLGEVADYSGNGIQPYDPNTKTYDEGDWGEVDTYEDNHRYIDSLVPEAFQSTYYMLDIGLDDHLDIDLNHNPANPVSNGTDTNNDGLFDNMDVNNDGDMTDWVTINEKIVGYGDDFTDQDLKGYLAVINPAAKKVFMMEQCFSGGFIGELSGPNTVIMTATEKETVSWGNVFIRNISRALTGIAYPDSSGDPATVDANYDGHNDLAEVFNFAAANDYYQEIPQYDDNGDSISHPYPLPVGTEGALGATIYPGAAAVFSGSIKINNDAVYTNSVSVTLNLVASDPTARMQFSNDGTTYSALEAYAPTKAWSLTTGNGWKTVYVKFVDANGVALGSYSDTITFDNVAPTFTGIAASGITATAATISWTSNEPADSQVEYGLTTSYGLTTALDPSLVTAHSQTLSGLTSGTVYHYRVKSRDAAGNLKNSADKTFTTLVLDVTPPVISAITASGITNNAATVSWTTNEVSDTQINYGLTTSYGLSTTLNTSLVTAHSQNLSGLTAATVYHYRVKSRDAAGNLAISGDKTFTTLSATDPLAAAVDNPSLVFTTGGNANWFSENSIYYYGGSAAQSGAIGNSQSTYMQTTVTGAGTLKFYWRVSSQSGGDYLTFYIDGVSKNQISGTTGSWVQKSYSITTTGTHTLKWVYSKNASIVKGSDAGWVDQVVFTAK